MTRRGVLLGGLVAAGGAVCTGVLGYGEAWALDAPSITRCDDWGARDPSQAIRIYNRRPVKILVHHTATPNVTDYSRDAAESLARSIQRYHMRTRGWADSGQHFTISRGGYALEGRHRSLEMLRGGRRQVEGAHCTGQNIVAVGIENEGTYTATGPPDKQWKRLVQMCAYVCKQYRIRPTQIFGHRDFKDTACPGDVLYAMLPKLRTQVAAALGARTEGRPDDTGTWPLLRVADRGADVLAAQYLLRATGLTDVAPDGRFDRTTADAVRGFQRTHGTEEINGMIGGESWPLLMAPTGTVSSRETARAVQALTTSSPTDMETADWQRPVLRASARSGR